MARLRSNAHAKTLFFGGFAFITRHFEWIDGDPVLWRAMVSDPEVYQSKWTVEIPLERRPGQKIFEYACHEGNQAVGNILRGARVQSSR
ncbi:MAG: hypothetical protein ACJ0Q3_03405 [Candidatus Azotimanducaceae bacterium]